MHQSIDVLGLSTEELDLLKRCQLSLLVESFPWILQEQWKVTVLHPNQKNLVFAGSKHQCVVQVQTTLAAIQTGLTQGIESEYTDLPFDVGLDLSHDLIKDQSFFENEQKQSHSTQLKKEEMKPLVEEDDDLFASLFSE
ncbi:hypothetical protein ACQ4M3_07860 [Leptolyngbya sp. AN03gr2]|uniref:hypothetical protein n=1 Tax=unclassified Leptolyngbya TaxID=2650499 RepID=UPI003D318210